MGLQLALNIRNIHDAVIFYSKLCGVGPHTQRDGYANFALDALPFKLVLFDNPATEQRLHHLSVEVFEPGELDHSLRRLSAAGICLAWGGLPPSKTHPAASGPASDRHGLCRLRSRRPAQRQRITTDRTAAFGRWRAILRTAITRASCPNAKRGIKMLPMLMANSFRRSM